MPGTIGIRREDKSQWERRVPITPDVVSDLQKRYGIETCVQPSHIRIIPDAEYARHGAHVQEDISNCKVVFAVKEIPAEMFKAGGAYVFFSHVIKGQSYNMPMLRRLMELGCTLIDYEKVTDEKGKRLIFFGRHAGAAGAIETLYALGRVLKRDGTANPFEKILRAYDYPDLAAAKDAVRRVGEVIRKEGAPEGVGPLVIGVAGYGNVGQGTWEVLDLLPIRRIEPEELARLMENGNYDRKAVYGVTFKEEHMVAPAAASGSGSGGSFDCQHYYAKPEEYRTIFDRYWPHLTALINAVYWDARYPRLITKAALAEKFSEGKSRLKVIGDVSCDIGGSIEMTVKSTEPDTPCYVYDPLTENVVDGFEGEGVVIMAVDILPSELPRDASESFSQALKDYIPIIANADYGAEFENLLLPPEIKHAVIVHKGRLTPSFTYLHRYLD